MKTHLEKALDYVRKNIDIDYLKGCITPAMQMRMPIGYVAPMLVDDIYDLLEEYGQDNDLPEGWWMSEIDVDEILFNL